MKRKQEDYYDGLPRWIHRNTYPDDKALLLTLLSHLNTRTGDCFPSVRTLTREVGVNRKTIYASRRRLKRYNLISYKPGRGGRNFCQYKLNWLNLSDAKEKLLKDFFFKEVLSQTSTRSRECPTVPNETPVTIPNEYPVTVPNETLRTTLKFNHDLIEQQQEKPAAVVPSFSSSEETPAPPVAPEKINRLVFQIQELGGIDKNRARALVEGYGYDKVTEKLDIIHSRTWNNPVGALIKALKDNWQRGDTQAIERHERRFKVTRDGIMPGAIPGQLFTWEDLIKGIGVEEKVREAVEKGYIKEYDY